MSFLYFCYSQIWDFCFNFLMRFCWGMSYQMANKNMVNWWYDGVTLLPILYFVKTTGVLTLKVGNCMKLNEIYFTMLKYRDFELS